MYQFIHVETYGKVSAKKKLNYNEETKGRNVKEILGEVTRKKGYCDHVEHPEDPILLYGVNPEQLEALTDDYFNNTKLVNNKGIKRGLRKDSHILLAGVISLNRDLENEIWEDYKKSSIEWLKNKYGDALKCVVEHQDEAHPHIHFYCVQENGKDFNLLHQGKKAFSLETKKYKKEIAFKEAMRDFQEDFYNDVSLGYGLMKTGPKRRRLTNKEYKQQQQEIRIINLFKNKTDEEVQLLISETERYIQDQKTKTNQEIIFLKEKAKDEGISLGKIKGFKSAIGEFTQKSLAHKIIFSKNFGNRMIIQLEKENEKLKNDNERLKEKNRELIDKKNRILKRKELYKSKYEKGKETLEYFNVLTDFINNDQNPEQQEENKNDIRTRIIAEIDKIETQQQQLNKGLKHIKPRSDLNISKIGGIGEKLNRSFRVLFSNVRGFIGDFFSSKLFERMFKEEKNDTIEKYEPKQKSVTVKKYRKYDDGTTIKKV